MKLLESYYGKPVLFAKDDPVDVLMRTVLSQNTTDKNSLAAFARLKEAFNSIRYAVVFTVSRRCTLFYDFSNNQWKSGQVPGGAMFKSRELAEFAVRLLAKERNERAKNGFFLSRNSRPPQVVALRIRHGAIYAS